ncbi:hypothetical protein [Methylomonas sp. HYX-M1]|uniref:DUF7477 domain-containing protein n=1 Tax=Methylomonas sp. HYX-M1 TaxID=3139307 RepID=UPI00345C25A0
MSIEVILVLTTIVGLAAYWYLAKSPAPEAEPKAPAAPQSVADSDKVPEAAEGDGQANTEAMPMPVGEIQAESGSDLPPEPEAADVLPQSALPSEPPLAAADKGYYFGRQFPERAIWEAWEAGLHVGQVAYGGGHWFMSFEALGYQDQRWYKGTEFPAELIQQSWNDGFHISAVTYAETAWLVVLSKIGQPTWQRLQFSDDFPGKAIGDAWNDGYRVSALAVGETQWLLVFTSTERSELQRWTLSDDFPEQQIRQGWAEGYYINNLAYGHGTWTLFMSNNPSGQNQTWQMLSDQACEDAQSPLGGPSRIVQAVYSDRQWVLIWQQAETGLVEPVSAS